MARLNKTSQSSAEKDQQRLLCIARTNDASEVEGVWFEKLQIFYSVELASCVLGLAVLVHLGVLL